MIKDSLQEYHIIRTPELITKVIGRMVHIMYVIEMN